MIQFHDKDGAELQPAYPPADPHEMADSIFRHGYNGKLFLALFKQCEIDEEDCFMLSELLQIFKKLAASPSVSPRLAGAILSDPAAPTQFLRCLSFKSRRIIEDITSFLFLLLGDSGSASEEQGQLAPIVAFQGGFDSLYHIVEEVVKEISVPVAQQPASQSNQFGMQNSERSSGNLTPPLTEQQQKKHQQNQQQRQQQQQNPSGSTTGPNPHATHPDSPYSVNAAVTALQTVRRLAQDDRSRRFLREVGLHRTVKLFGRLLHEES